MSNENNINEVLLGPEGHKYAMDFSKKRSAAAAASSLPEPAEKKAKPAAPNTPGQTFKNLGGGVARITNDPELIEKGRPPTEYKFSSGWTTINNPLASASLYRDRVRPPTLYDYLDLGDDYDAKEEEDVSGEEAEVMTVQEPTVPKPKAQIPNTLILSKNGGLGSIDGLDLSAVLKKDKAKFSTGQEKEFCRWIRKHKTYQVGTLKTEFDVLLKELGFSNEKLKPELLLALRTKVRGRFNSLREAFLKAGAAKEGKDADGKPELVFALWTEYWEKADWNGDYTAPKSIVQKSFESNFN